MSSNGGGDQLARGAIRAQFKPPDVSDEEWNQIFDEAERKLAQMSDEDRQKLEAEDAARLLLIEEQKKVPIGQVRIRAVQDRIIVRRVETETITGSLFLADESKEKPAEGIVLALGPGKFVDGKLVQTSIQVGERVVFGKFSGQEAKLGLEVVVILREEDIFFVKEAVPVEPPVEPIIPAVESKKPSRKKKESKEN
jgi:chaperonin GroES